MEPITGPTIVSTNSIGKGDRIISDDSFADYVVAAGVIVQSTDDHAGIKLTASGHDLTVNGTVIGEFAVTLGNDHKVDGDQSLIVGASGNIIGSLVGAQINGSATLNNAGDISGGNYGLYSVLWHGDASTIINTGTIAGGFAGVGVSTYSDNITTLTNEGTIRGTGLDAKAFAGSAGRELVTNSGLMVGDVFLSAGNDLFDNRSGTVEDGTIEGQQGADRFVLGAGSETVVGGDGVDTLDFRSSATGVRVSLLDADGSANTGRAKNDVYTEIEKVLGSNTGTDILIGDGQNNTFVGNSGVDALGGGAGKDTLVGGSGADTLHGGSGSDLFVFAEASHGGDRIQDWSRVKDNFDAFGIDASGFGGGLTAGLIVTDLQFAVQTDNVARSAQVRLIWETDSTRLWFDWNGSADGGRTLLADLADGTEVTRFDFLLM